MGFLAAVCRSPRYTIPRDFPLPFCPASGSLNFCAASTRMWPGLKGLPMRITVLSDGAAACMVSAQPARTRTRPNTGRINAHRAVLMECTLLSSAAPALRVSLLDLLHELRVALVVLGHQVAERCRAQGGELHGHVRGVLHEGGVLHALLEGVVQLPDDVRGRPLGRGQPPPLAHRERYPLLAHRRHVREGPHPLLG